MVLCLLETIPGNRQLSISKNETMVADADITNSRVVYFIGIVYIRSIRRWG